MDRFTHGLFLRDCYPFNSGIGAGKRLSKMEHVERYDVACRAALTTSPTANGRGMTRNPRRLISVGGIVPIADNTNTRSGFIKMRRSWSSDCGSGRLFRSTIANRGFEP